MMKCAIALVAALALSAPAAAQHTHGPQKGPNGGQMDDVAGVHAELLIAGNIITINIYDEESKPVVTAGFTGSALVIRGSEREPVALKPEAPNALKGEAKKAVAGAAITLTLKTAAGKSGQVRFKP